MRQRLSSRSALKYAVDDAMSRSLVNSLIIPVS